MRQKELNNFQLGKAVGLSHVTIGNYVGGKIPKSQHLQALAKFFGVTMEWLLSGDDLQSPDYAIREGDDLNAELNTWRKRATSAEKDLADLKQGLRKLLAVEPPQSELPKKPERIYIHSGLGKISSVSTSQAEGILDAASDEVRESGPGSPPKLPAGAPTAEEGKHKRGAGPPS